MRKTLIALLTTGSLALTGLGLTTVHAATSTTDQAIHHQKFGFGMHGDQTALAKLLGVTPEELKSELAAGKKLQDIATTHNITVDQLKQLRETERQNALPTLKQKLAQEVADGKITQAQMDQMIQRMTNPPVRTPHQPMIPAGLATLLNMSVSDIQTQLKAGKTLQQIATEHNVTSEQMNQYFATEHQNMLNKMKEELTKKVQEGKITQTQMDEMIQKMSSNSTKPFMGGFMKGGRGEFKNKANITTPTPSTSQVQ